MVNLILRMKNLCRRKKRIRVNQKIRFSSRTFLDNQSLGRNKKMMRAIIHKENKNYPQVENVLINCVLRRRSIKKFDQEYRTTNTASFVKIAMRTISIISIVNFVSKFIQITAKMKTMTNGLVVTTVKDG